jgi:hypothetical protein
MEEEGTRYEVKRIGHFKANRNKQFWSTNASTQIIIFNNQISSCKYGFTKFIQRSTQIRFQKMFLLKYEYL